MAVENILVTGGTGLIGSNLAGQLARRGYQVSVLGRGGRFAVPEAVPPDAARKVQIVTADVADPQALAELVKNSDAVYHKAASVGMAGSVESARDYVGSNMLATGNLVDALRSSGQRVKKVILGSSISVYGEGNYSCVRCGTVRPEVRGVPSSSALTSAGFNPACPTCGGAICPVATGETAQRNGESIYAVTKKAQEDLLAGTCRQLGIALTILRYSTVLGPGQSWHNPFSRVLEQLAVGQAPNIHEDGQQTRDFIFISDLVEANILALRDQVESIDVFNVSAVHMSLLEFVQALSRSVAHSLSRQPIQPVIDSRFIAGDIRHCWCDTSKLERELGFLARVDLEEGVDNLVSWFLRHKGLSPSATGSSSPGI